jgi:transcriptional regulator with XRE-family HTH domain
MSSAPGGDTEELSLGARVRRFRRLRGLSLEELATRLGVSTATMSNIERDRISVDVERLLALSSALSINHADLVPRAGGSHFEVVRRSVVRTAAPAPRAVDSQGRQVPYHNGVRPLAQGVIGKQIEPFLIRAMPIADEDVSFINHGHEEFFFVLSGTIECRLKTPDGLVTQTLHEGDSMYFWSSLPHCIRSATSEPAEALHVLCVAQSDRLAEQQSRTATIYSREWPLTVTQRVGGRVRALRVASRMTVQEFAEAANVGARWLADAERGRKAIPVTFLLTLCRRFQKPIDFFLVGALTPPPYCFVQRAADVPSIPPRRRRLSDPRLPSRADIFRPLASGFPKRSMHPYYVKLDPHDCDADSIREHHGQEFVYVLNGEIEVRTIVDCRPHVETLSAGDACFIDSTVPHRFVGASVNPFAPGAPEVITLFWSPLGEEYLFAEETAER